MAMMAMTTSNSINVNPPEPVRFNVIFFITTLSLSASNHTTRRTVGLLQQFMTKKNIWLISLLLVLVGIYICFFTDWFKPHTIKILDTERQLRRFHTRNDLPYVLFVMEGRFQLTELKVVSLADYQKNSETPPLWHLVSDSNSVPVKAFVYGQHIHGMKPAFEGEDPQPLDTNVVYRLFVSAGGIKGSHDFKIR
jgi:hypothetical protein